MQTIKQSADPNKSVEYTEKRWLASMTIRARLERSPCTLPCLNSRNQSLFTLSSSRNRVAPSSPTTLLISSTPLEVVLAWLKGEARGSTPSSSTSPAPLTSGGTPESSRSRGTGTASALQSPVRSICLATTSTTSCPTVRSGAELRRTASKVKRTQSSESSGSQARARRSWSKLISCPLCTLETILNLEEVLSPSISISGVHTLPMDVRGMVAQI